MTITARYPGRCSKCGDRITPGQQIDWDKTTRATSHIKCPPSRAQQLLAGRAGGVQHPKGTNRRPGECERCGQYLQPGEGRLVYCVEDSGCLKHHDHDGYHLYCADEAACKARREAAKQAATRRKEMVQALMATVGERVEAPQGLRRLARYGGGASVYSASYFVVDENNSVYYQKWEPNPFDSFDLVTYATTATVDQVEAAVKGGALARDA